MRNNEVKRLQRVVAYMCATLFALFTFFFVSVSQTAQLEVLYDYVATGKLEYNGYGTHTACGVAQQTGLLPARVDSYGIPAIGPYTCICNRYRPLALYRRVLLVGVVLYISVRYYRLCLLGFYFAADAF